MINFKDQKVVFLGQMEYEKCLQLQKELHDLVSRDQHGSVVLIVEHPPTITCGYQSNKSSLKVAEEVLESQNIKFIETDRGGDMTAHEPGQLVIYPIFNLGGSAKGLIGPKTFVGILESTIIDWLANLGVSATIDPLNPGVWVSSKKIAAVGIRIKNRTTYHGISINIFNNLRTFSFIVPCGLKEKEVTSLKALTGTFVNLEETGRCLGEKIYNAVFSDINA